MRYLVLTLFFISTQIIAECPVDTFFSGISYEKNISDECCQNALKQRDIKYAWFIKAKDCLELAKEKAKHINQECIKNNIQSLITKAEKKVFIEFMAHDLHKLKHTFDELYSNICEQIDHVEEKNLKTEIIELIFTSCESINHKLIEKEDNVDIIADLNERINKKIAEEAQNK
ncbi:hypothetical protein BN1013_00837 [Candidatus Rubidus massiliensis]|nr:hypothetical protein BN1013_00837 [Candidatus Rubidus massiliensis]